MKPRIYDELIQEAQIVAKKFSNPDREKNKNKESFNVVDNKILSENTAIIIMHKSPTNKLALFFFYYVNVNNGWWAYFVPTDSHFLGMSGAYLEYVKIENYNKTRGKK